MRTTVSTLAERSKLSRVLIVEDHPSQLRTLTCLLETEGIETIGVPTGTEALAVLDREEVGIVVVDLRLPDRTGTALLEELKARSGMARIIIHTGYGSFATAKDAVNLGAFAYIEKGEDPQELVRHVQRAREANLARYTESLEAAVAQRTAELERRYEELRNLHELVSRLNAAGWVGEVYEAALDVFTRTLSPDRASILLLDSDGVLRFKAWRGLSAEYRRAVESLSSWKSETTDAQPLLVSDAAENTSLEPYRSAILKEGIQSLASIPLLAQGRLIGRCTLYSNVPRRFTSEEVRLAQTIAAQVAFAVIRKQAEEALSERERAMRTLVTSLPGVVYRCLNDPDWTLEYISDQVRELVGYTPEEFLSSRVTWTRLMHPDDVGRVWDEVQAAVAQARPFQLEYRVRARDGRELSVWEQGQAVMNPDSSVAAREGFIMDITARKKVEEAARRSYEERERISHDLHDGILQSLYAVGLGLEATKRDVEPASRAVLHRLDSAILQLNALLLEVRGFIVRMTTPGGATLDLDQAIHSLTEAFAAAGTGDITVQLDPCVAASFPAEQGAHVMNIVKEALSNSVRHARAAHRSVTLGRFRGEIRLEIRDDGTGFHVNRRRGASGMGLTTMLVRAKKLGGRLSIISRPGKGTRVVLSLPPCLLPDSSDVLR